MARTFFGKRDIDAEQVDVIGRKSTACTQRIGPSLLTQYFQQWWIGTFPGLAIFTAVVAFNFLGDSLRDFFDPTSAADRGR